MTQWTAQITVTDGKRPAWLTDGDKIRCIMSKGRERRGRSCTVQR